MAGGGGQKPVQISFEAVEMLHAVPANQLQERFQVMDVFFCSGGSIGFVCDVCGVEGSNGRILMEMIGENGSGDPWGPYDTWGR